MSRLQKALFLSDKGYADLKKAIFACTLTNLAMLLPFCVTVMVFSEILTPFVSGDSIQWNHIWMLWGAGIVSAILVFLAAKNDYRKTYIASYKESNTTRLRIAEHLRKLPMNFFNTKDLSELTTNMMADCSSMESLLSSTIPPLIANGITVTLTCILLAFFDWRLALCVFITVPIAFLIIWLSRNHQKKLFEKQVSNDFADVLSAGPDGPSHSPIVAAGGSTFCGSRDGLASFDSAFDRMCGRGRSIYCFGGAVFLFFSH